MIGLRRWLLAGIGAAASAAAALGAPTAERFDANPTLSPSQAPGAWYTDRYAPAGFASAVFDGDNRLKHSISAADCATCRPPAFSSAFYNTQGRDFDLPAGTTVMSIDLFIPSSWATANKRMAGFWGVAHDGSEAIVSYPIVEFTSDGGVPRFHGWDESIGDWVDMGLPTGFTYDRWYTLHIRLVGTQWVYQVGDLSLALTASGATHIASTILQGYNTTSGVSYDIYWDNFLTGPQAALALSPVSTCVTDHTVSVRVDVSGATDAVVGGQFFLQYDNSVLQFSSASVGNAPFTQPILSTHNQGLGTIDFAVGVPGGGPGTIAPTTMAVFTFTAAGDVCATNNLVSFRPHDPPSRLTNSTGDSLAVTLADLPSIRIDATAPAIACPPDVTVNADAGGCTAAASSILGTGWAIGGDAALVDASPDHGLALSLSSVTPPGTFSFVSHTLPAPIQFANLNTLSADYNMQAGCFGGGAPRFSLRIDYDNNGVESAGDHSIFVYFGTPPNFTDCPPLNTWLSTGNLITTADLRFDTSQFPGGNFYSTHAQAVALLGSFNIIRVSMAVDGQFSPGSQIAWVDNINVNGDLQTFNSATASDSCTAAPVIAGARDDAQPLTSPYPVGDTHITWTATDECGNSSSCIQTVHVNNFNTMTATVTLDGVFTTTFDRCVTFSFRNGCGPATEVQELMHFVNGTATGTFTDIPAACAGWTRLVARDPLHTLRRIADAGHFGVSGTQYTATFTGADALISGNANDDAYVDILDFGAMVGQFGATIGANTACGAPFPHTDFSGDGAVFAADFQIIQVNFLKTSDSDICGNAVQAPPLQRVSVEELMVSNPGLIIGDVDHDGWMDQHDVVVVLSLGGLPCRADWNGDGQLTPSDVAQFVNTWFAGLSSGNPQADFDGNGAITPADIAGFVNAWVAALANGCGR